MASDTGAHAEAGGESDLDRIAAELLDEMRQQPVPPRLRALAEELQAALDARKPAKETEKQRADRPEGAS